MIKGHSIDSCRHLLVVLGCLHFSCQGAPPPCILGSVAPSTTMYATEAPHHRISFRDTDHPGVGTCAHAVDMAL